MSIFCPFFPPSQKNSFPAEEEERRKKRSLFSTYKRQKSAPINLTSGQKKSNTLKEHIEHGRHTHGTRQTRYLLHILGHFKKREYSHFSAGMQVCINFDPILNGFTLLLFVVGSVTSLGRRRRATQITF